MTEIDQNTTCHLFNIHFNKLIISKSKAAGPDSCKIKIQVWLYEKKSLLNNKKSKNLFHLLNFQFSLLQTTNFIPVDGVKLYGAGRPFLGRGQHFFEGRFEMVCCYQWGLCVLKKCKLVCRLRSRISCLLMYQ